MDVSWLLRSIGNETTFVQNIDHPAGLPFEFTMCPQIRQIALVADTNRRHDASAMFT